MSRAILVAGATGRQGGAVVKYLLKNTSDLTILAVTRNKDSPSARRLSDESSRVALVQGDLDNAAELFANARRLAETRGNDGIWGVFSVQNPMASGQSVGKEIQQGKDMIDQSLKNGVQHFVYSSVDRGGDTRSFENPTPVPHFASKHEIERHLLNQTASGAMGWTILRPTGFMDNYVPGFQGKVFLTAWKCAIGKDKPQQVVATSDIGLLAAEAFLQPGKFRGRAISIAGDEVTFDEAARIFERKTGHAIPTTYGIVSTLVLKSAKDIGIMFKWFNEEGFGADTKQLRKEFPQLIDFGTYIETQSGFVAK
ncbi:hypothetical protein ACJ41O_012149 [Fusarium nematophilum]